MIKILIQSIFKKFGLQLKIYSSSDVGRRNLLMEKNDINKIIDVGANIGQYALELRRDGFKGEIISFEPLADAFLKLKNNAKNDKKWQVYDSALGNEDGHTFINVAGNSVSSSISNMQDSHLKAAPYSSYVGKEKISINKLDSLFGNFYSEDDRIMLKIDTQGFEKNVIDGAEKFLEKVILLQLEMSLISLYENEMLFKEMIEYLKERNFQIVSLENGFFDKQSGQLFQVDGIFINKNNDKSNKSFLR